MHDVVEALPNPFCVSKLCVKKNCECLLYVCTIDAVQYPFQTKISPISIDWEFIFIVDASEWTQRKWCDLFSYRSPVYKIFLCQFVFDTLWFAQSSFELKEYCVVSIANQKHQNCNGKVNKIRVK